MLGYSLSNKMKGYPSFHAWLLHINTTLFLYFIVMPSNRLAVEGDRKALYAANGEFLPHVRLAKDLVDKKRYDSRVRPVANHSQPTRITLSMSLYQILAINEKVQSVDLNVWVIQKWTDEFRENSHTWLSCMIIHYIHTFSILCNLSCLCLVGWDPNQYGMINSTILPYQSLWLPDTYLYNSIVMNREESERYINLVVSTNHWAGERGAQVMFMYPALYRTSCRIHIRHFPYDQQNCTLIISSWTSDRGSIDYWPEFADVNMENFIPNEEWVVVSFHIRRVEESFVCCPEPWVLLHASLVVRRKPLYYIVNLVVPTSVITLVAVTGFFTPASTSNERREKLSLGIDSLLAMSILMMMVSEQMPTTSDYIPLFGIFYLTIIGLIFAGTLFTALILNVHLQKAYNKPVSPLVSFIFFHKLAPLLRVRPSTALLELWMETGVRIRGLDGGRMPTTWNSMAAARRRRKAKHKRRRLTLSLTPRLSIGLAQAEDKEEPTSEETVEEEGDNAAEGGTSGCPAHRNWRRVARRASEQKRVLLTLDAARLNSQMHRQLQQQQTSPTSTMELATIRATPPLLSRNDSKGPRAYVGALSLGAMDGLRYVDSAPSPTSRTSSTRGSLPRQRHSAALPLHPSSPPLPSPPLPPAPLPKYDTLKEQLSSPLSNVCSPSQLRPTPSFAIANNSGASGIELETSPTDNRPPAIQLYSLANAARTAAGLGGAAAGIAGGSNDVALFEMKLRRRYAHEWEFLASVLDRLLLIVFAGLVMAVTVAMLLFGEIIQFTYDTDDTQK